MKFSDRWEAIASHPASPTGMLTRHTANQSPIGFRHAASDQYSQLTPHITEYYSNQA